jgi:NAD(P)H-dependent FMN reductase
MSDSATVRILGIAGSLRRGSFNAVTLRAAQELAPPGMTIDSFDIAPIPLYNEDVRQRSPIRRRATSSPRISRHSRPGCRA